MLRGPSSCSSVMPVDEVLERTPIGAVLRRAKGRSARIYVNGLRVAEEEKFLFSYDITSLSAGLRRALNRERSNVGRTAYSDRVKAILLAATARSVADVLAADLAGFERGTQHDETNWLDVALHACAILNAFERVVFLTSWQLVSAPEYVGRARDDGYRIVIVPDALQRKLGGTIDIAGDPIVDLGVFQERWNAGFAFSFVDVKDLAQAEREVFSRTDAIIALQGRKPRAIQGVLISETMRINATGTATITGLWDAAAGRIVIRRDQLRSLETYAGVLLHEVTHARTEAPDVSSPFEDALTQTLGVVASRSV